MTTTRAYLESIDAMRSAPSSDAERVTYLLDVLREKLEALYDAEEAKEAIEGEREDWNERHDHDNEQIDRAFAERNAALSAIAELQTPRAALRGTMSVPLTIDAGLVLYATSRRRACVTYEVTSKLYTVWQQSDGRYNWTYSFRTFAKARRQADASEPKMKHALPCPGCGRARSTCWTMPCLHLETLLERARSSARGERRVQAWVRAGGGPTIQRKDAT